MPSEEAKLINFNTLAEDINSDINITWEIGYLNRSGIINNNDDNYRLSNFIPTIKNDICRQIYYETYIFKNIAIGLYNDSKELIGLVLNEFDSINKYTNVITHSDAAYIRVSTYKRYINYVVIKYSLINFGIDDDSINGNKIINNSINIKKLGFIVRNPESNLFNSYSSGYISGTTGDIVNHSDLVHTDYIPLIPGMTYYAQNINAGYSVYYDSNKKFVDKIQYSDRKFTVPQDTESPIAFGRFSFNTSELADAGYIFTRDVFPDKYSEELYSSEVSIIANKSIDINKLAYIEHDPFTDFINHDKDSQGYINASGVLTANTSYKCSDYIALEQNKTYYLRNVIGQYCAFFDENYNYLSTFPQNGTIYSKSFIMPVNAKYIRVSSNNVDKGFSISLNSGEPRNYAYCQSIIRDAVNEKIPTDFTGNDICAFNKILCIGDSLTVGGFNNDQNVSLVNTKGSLYCWPTQLGKITGCQITNKSNSGLTTVGWYDKYKDDDLSGHDCAIIQLGVNDGSFLGGFVPEVEEAYQNIFSKLKSENNNIKIFVSTIIKAESYGSTRTYSESLINFIQSLNDPNIIILDMNLYDHLAESKGYNSGHLSAYGYWRLAQDYKNYISWYMYTHKEQFQYIQFIGTNYTYNGGGNTTGNI